MMSKFHIGDWESLNNTFGKAACRGILLERMKTKESIISCNDVKQKHVPEESTKRARATSKIWMVFILFEKFSGSTATELCYESYDYSKQAL